MSSTSSTISLRRSCQACAKVKRRCDRLIPKCSRCSTKGINCEYVNAPLAAGMTSKIQKQKPIRAITSIPPSLDMEILKTFEPSIVRFIVNGMRDFPNAFARDVKTSFIHPDLYDNLSLPGPIQDLHIICASYNANPSSQLLCRVLKQKSAEIRRQAARASTFEDLLVCIQALVLAQCILVFDRPENDDQYLESTTNMLTGLAWKLWQQAPIQLPHTLSPRRAWLLAESVRRTIIVAYILRSAYSFDKRNYSVRTPFIEALPFDVRTSLWDAPAENWEEAAVTSQSSMVSLREYSGMLESGRVHGISAFGNLILAACKGKTAATVQFPSRHPTLVS
ncbi:hypothetical protein ASPWEDRAFT_534080 [Aspergillus wentii DTO 134E9]|uniref:Zn(2)-C6 fungal-type domain-containing protein n=1 Tax=Aspergillus wentii DTO 134E9 TaxID=1073089 RepID=A0A1L9RM38_ASPWE|nr:uncharacterized protein ASPWEDRAFT_534080 [Aspergillus wentii DTO 134E9]KAI9929536.1 hypothetical protein MW887_001009 [Aspergillus wentii]OJJ36020.1 hypothetical protein ASPWEDRAFT_534080 [Aspergillus wentii DTO 134E9]